MKAVTADTLVYPYCLEIRSCGERRQMNALLFFLVLFLCLFLATPFEGATYTIFTFPDVTRVIAIRESSRTVAASAAVPAAVPAAVLVAEEASTATPGLPGMERGTAAAAAA
jgi:hypothetical protein